MLCYDRIDISEDFAVNKTSTSKMHIICHYWYFLLVLLFFKFQPAVCNECHDVLMMLINNDSISILNVHGVDYRCIIAGISNSEAINLFKKTSL